MGVSIWRRDKSILLLLILIQIIITAALTINAKLPVSNYTEEPYHYTEVLRGFDNIADYWKTTVYQPAYYITSIITAAILGKTIFGMLFVNIIFFSVLIFSTYKLAEKLFDRRVALASSILIILIPGYFLLSRELALENGVAAMIPLCTYLLLMTDRFKSVKYSILLGAAIGLGFLVKFSFIFYLLPIILCYLIREKAWKELFGKNSLIIILIALAVALTWYSPNLREIYDQLFRISYLEAGSAGSLPKLYSMRALLFYPKIIFFQFLEPALTIMFLISAYHLVKNKKYFLLASLTPIILLLLVPNKQIRYLLPIAPFFAIIIAAGFYETKKRMKQVFLVLLGVSIILFIAAGLKQDGSAMKQLLFGQQALFDKERPDIEKVFLELGEDKTFIVVSDGNVDAYTLGFYSKMHGWNGIFKEACYLFPDISPIPDEETKMEGFILVSNEGLTKEYLYERIGLSCSRYPGTEEFDGFYEDLTTGFSPKKEIMVSKDIKLIVYGKSS